VCASLGAGAQSVNGSVRRKDLIWPTHTRAHSGWFQAWNALPRTRDTVKFCSGDLAKLVNERLRPAFRAIWFVGGGVVSGDCLRLGLADEVRYSILPILIGDGISFFEKLDREIALHLAEVKAYRSGLVELSYEVRGLAAA
jgi:dihydrofolate reductase